mmetsp:Transcript_4599/g.6102  ORF Transcript_4599/g.6102 Transcript_4599/m.6102 type:complete len:186 (+) Transcript_4599:274-831(+)
MTCGVTPPAVIVHKNRRFLIMETPTERNIEAYAKVLKEENVSTVVRTCEPAYPADRLKAKGIGVKELYIKDGSAPSRIIIKKWLQIIEDVFSKEKRKQKSEGTSTKIVTTTVAVHCITGLGRAPVCTAISLIELGMDPVDAILAIRSIRKGSFNKRQEEFLIGYQKIGLKKNRRGKRWWKACFGL